MTTRYERRKWHMLNKQGLARGVDCVPWPARWLCKLGKHHWVANYWRPNGGGCHRQPDECRRCGRWRSDGGKAGGNMRAPGPPDPWYSR